MILQVSSSELLWTMAGLAVVGIIFRNMEEVNLFIWTWIRNLLTEIIDFLDAVVFDVIGAFLKAGELTVQVWNILKFYSGKQIELVSAMWIDAVRDETVPVRTAVQKLEGSRNKILTPTLTTLEKVIVGVGHVWLTVLEPIREAVYQVSLNVSHFRFAHSRVASRTDDLIATQALETTKGFQPILDDGNEARPWWKLLVAGNGLLQPKTLIASLAALAGPLTGMWVNQTLVVDRDEAMTELRDTLPRLTRDQMFFEVRTGVIRTLPGVDDAVALLETLVLPETSRRGRKPRAP